MDLEKFQQDHKGVWKIPNEMSKREGMTKRNFMAVGEELADWESQTSDKEARLMVVLSYLLEKPLDHFIFLSITLGTRTISLQNLLHLQ